MVDSYLLSLLLVELANNLAIVYRQLYFVKWKQEQRIPRWDALYFFCVEAVFRLHGPSPPRRELLNLKTAFFAPERLRLDDRQMPAQLLAACFSYLQ